MKSLLEARRLPPTVNMHVVGFCNYKCHFCYARFVNDQQRLDLDVAKRIIDGLAGRQARRITFAGGEPTLHPDLGPMLRQATENGLITSLVTNGALVDHDFAHRMFPWLRWLVLSCDSAVGSTSRALGRYAANEKISQPERVLALCRMVHEWNKHRPIQDNVRLKINLVVTAVNSAEDPTEWLLECRPERVKLLQCLVVPGENEDARELQCPAEDFARYAERVRRIEREGIHVAVERSDDLLDSYAMIDPRGRFRQAHGDGYRLSQEIDVVGIDTAWAQVGGCDLERFAARGGVYDDGEPARGITAPIIAIEGLDGVGKSTTVTALARRLHAEVVHSPPRELSTERAEADRAPASVRRAFYWAAGERTMDHAIEKVFMGKTVVMDRSFASTAAFEAAEQERCATATALPPRTRRPDAIFLLVLPEYERRTRIAGRAGTLTDEERRLCDDTEFRNRVLTGYRNLGVFQVDARGTTEDIIDRIVAMCQQHGMVRA